MIKRYKRLALMFVACFACVLFVAACGSKKHSTAAPPITGTSEPSGPAAPLTGLPESDANIRNLPLLAVKIDNHPQARPQFGLQYADDIIEEKVEGDISRFMALFQSQSATQLGPVRSLRTTDPNWLRPEGGMIAYSGGIPQVEALLAPNGITDLGADSHGTTYYKRRSDRPFDHSMWVNTDTLRTLTPKGLAPAKPLFEYLAAGQKFGGSTATPVTSISVQMSGAPTAVHFDWTWDPGSGKFLRGTDGQPHMLENAGQIAMKNVIVQFTPYSGTPWVDTAGTHVDQADVVGSGDAWILSDGKIIQGKWSRPTADSITAYTDSTGAPVKLQPGHTWVSLVPPGAPSAIH